jgi:carbon storage regulator
MERSTMMLVLSRKKNESIVINDDITIVVIEVRGDKVRLGVECPAEFPVHRNEVYEALRRNRELVGAVNGFGGESPRPAAVDRPPAIEAPPPRDGFCCPQCQSDDVRVERLKPAYQGRELVRRRKCAACDHEFHTI